MTTSNPDPLDSNFDEDPFQIPRPDPFPEMQDPEAEENARPDETKKNPPLWRVFSPADAASLLAEAECQNEFGKGQLRVDWLEVLAQDPHGGLRPLIYPVTNQIEATQRLLLTAPHFARLFELIVPSLGAAFHTGRALELPPILLLGEPGIGKTFVAREFAKCIGMPAVSISMPNQSTTNVFAGRDMCWKSPALGIVARTLVSNHSASPLIILDEIDKTAGRSSEYGDQLGPLHDLLEPSTAVAFEDELLKVRFDASRICWIATANDLASLPPSLIDRFLVLEIQPPSEQQMTFVIESVYQDLIRSWGAWFSTTLSSQVNHTLRQTHPRKARQTLSLALTMAAHADRHTLDVEDITQAVRIVDQGTSRQRMGFV